jgi:hypothetical protein
VVALLREHNKRSTVDGSSTLTSLAAVPTATLMPGKLCDVISCFYLYVPPQVCTHKAQYPYQCMLSNKKLIPCISLVTLLPHIHRPRARHAGLRQAAAGGVQAPAPQRHRGRRQGALGRAAQGMFALLCVDARVSVCDSYYEQYTVVVIVRNRCQYRRYSIDHTTPCEQD